MIDKLRYPAIMEKEAAEIATDGAEVKKDVEKLLKEARKLLKKNPDLSVAKAKEAQDQINSFQRTVRIFEEKQSAFNKTRTSYQEVIRNTDEVIQGTINYLEALKKKGYAISIDKELETAQKERKVAQDILSKNDDVPDYQSVIDRAEEALKRAEMVRNAWERRLNTQKGNTKKINELRNWNKSFPLLIQASQKDFERLKAATPNEVWNPVSGDQQKASEFIKEFGALIDEAERLNSMDSQNFDKAASLVEKISALKNKSIALLAQPEEVLREYVAAKANAEKLSTQLQQCISQAEKVNNHSDSDGIGRNNIAQAKEKLSESEKLKKSSLPNWLLVAAALGSGIALAQRAEQEAENRVQEAENARRRRKREEENRRRREEEAEEERRRAARRRASTYSSSSGFHSSGGSSSFGGFGGGGFGGGGASGRW